MKEEMLTDQIMGLLLEQWSQMTPVERESFDLVDAENWCEDENAIDNIALIPEDVYKIMADFNAAYGINDDING